MRLVCFPHAGGSASYYYPVSKRFSPADNITAQLLTLSSKPAVLFGHSMGATLAFEVAWRLEHAGIDTPLRVIASGRRGPTILRQEKVHLRNDAGIREEIRRLNDTGSAVLDDEEILQAALPAIRGDYKAIEMYSYVPGRTLSCPVTALTGDSDPTTTVEEASEWRSVTTGPLRIKVFPGGHFYLTDNALDVNAEIAGDIGQVRNETLAIDLR